MYMVYTRKYHGLIDQLLHLFVYCHSLEQLSWERQDWAFTLIILGLIDPVCLCHLTGSFPSPCGITHHFVPVAIATDHWSTPHPRYWLIKMQLMESVLFYKRNRPPYLLAHHFSPICSVKDKKITWWASLPNWIEWTTEQRLIQWNSSIPASSPLCLHFI